MNIHIANDGNRTIQLTKSEIKTLQRARCILGDLCRFDPSLTARMDNWGGCAIAEVLELPFCQPRTVSKAQVKQEEKSDAEVEQEDQED